MIVLDTNVCVGILHSDPKVASHLAESNDLIAVPGMVEGELYYGIEKSTRKSENKAATEEFLEGVEIVYSDHEIMAKFGELKGTLEQRGTRIDDADLIIAATALCRNAALATGNVKHFERIDGLRIENWFA